MPILRIHFAALVFFSLAALSPAPGTAQQVDTRGDLKEPAEQVRPKSPKHEVDQAEDKQKTAAPAAGQDKTQVPPAHSGIRPSGQPYPAGRLDGAQTPPALYVSAEEGTAAAVRAELDPVITKVEDEPHPEATAGHEHGGSGHGGEAGQAGGDSGHHQPTGKKSPPKSRQQPR